MVLALALWDSTVSFAQKPKPKPPKPPVLGTSQLAGSDGDDHFPPQDPRNVGILNGEPSGNALDVDLDCGEARLAAPRLLPQ